MAKYLYNKDQIITLTCMPNMSAIGFLLDLGFGIQVTQKAKWARITPKVEAYQFVEDAIHSAKELKLVLYPLQSGQYLADVFIDGKSLNQELLTKGLALPYEKSKYQKKV